MFVKLTILEVLVCFSEENKDHQPAAEKLNKTHLVRLCIGKIIYYFLRTTESDTTRHSDIPIPPTTYLHVLQS